MTLPVDSEIAAVLRKLAEKRAPTGTFCPSEAARVLSDNWRDLMPDVRRVAAAMEEIEATQGGVVVEPEAAKGPIRLRRAQPSQP